MERPILVDVIYRGMDASSPAEQETIARELAVEFHVAVEETRRLLSQVDTPLRTLLGAAAAEQLAARLGNIGIRVELVAAPAQAEQAARIPTPRIGLTIPCRRCRRELAVEVAVCPYCGTSIGGNRYLESDLARGDEPEAPSRPLWQQVLMRSLPLLLLVAVGLGTWQYQVRHNRLPPAAVLETLPAPQVKIGESFAAETRSVLAALNSVQAAANLGAGLRNFSAALATAQGATGSYLQRWPGVPPGLDPTSAALLKSRLQKSIDAYGDAGDLWRSYGQRKLLAWSDGDVLSIVARHPGLARYRYHVSGAPRGIDYVRMPAALESLWQEGGEALDQLDRLVKATVK